MTESMQQGDAVKHHAVFISYRSLDEKIASSIKDEIEKYFPGLRVFLSSHYEDGTTLGKSYQPELKEKISQSAFVVFLMTKAWGESDVCREEYRIAKSENKVTFVLFLEQQQNFSPKLQEIHRELGSETYSEIYPPSIDRACQKVIGSLKKYIEENEAFEHVFFAFKGGNPYPGLGVYDINEAAVYFGREEEVHKALRFFTKPEDKHRFLLIHGASGSGKSSFMRAGILSRIVEFHKEWFLLGGNVLRPSTNPFKNLCRVLLQASGGKFDNIDEVIKTVHNKESFENLLFTLQTKKPYLLLAIDQFEELYQNYDAYVDFFDALRIYLQTDRCYVIATVRTEYLQNVQSEMLDTNRNIAQAMEVYNLPPVSIGAIHDIITGPFEKHIVIGDIEDGFVDSVKYDLSGKTKALPLLSLYLHTHYEEYNGHFYTKDYKKGALFETINDKAKDAIDGISENDKTKLKEVFIRYLVFFDESKEKSLRKSVHYDMLTSVQHWIDRLIDARLLVKEIKGDDATVEVVHEAVFEHWKLLNGWIEEEKDFFALLKKVELHFEDWKQAEEKKKNEALLGGLLLEEALKVKERFDDELKGFVEESESYQKQQKEEKAKVLKQRRNFMMAAASFFGIGGVVSTYEWYEAEKAKQKALASANEAEEQKRKALVALEEVKQNLGLVLAEKAKFYADKQLLAEATLYSLEALLYLKKDISIEERSSVKNICYNKWPIFLPFLTLKANSFIYDVFLQNDRLFISTNTSFIQRDISNNKTLNKVVFNQKSVFSKIVSDGKYLVQVLENKKVQLWDIHLKKLLKETYHNLDGVCDLIYIEKKEKIIMTSELEGNLNIWYLATNNIIKKFNQYVCGILALSPDQQLFVCSGQGDDSNFIDIRTTDTYEIVSTIQDLGEAEINQIKFLDNSKLIICSLSPTLFIVDLKQKKLEQILSIVDPNVDGIWSIAISTDGKYIFAGSNTGRFYVYDSKYFTLVQQLVFNVGIRDIKTFKHTNKIFLVLENKSIKILNNINNQLLQEYSFENHIKKIIPFHTQQKIGILSGNNIYIIQDKKVITFISLKGDLESLLSAAALTEDDNYLIYEVFHERTRGKDEGITFVTGDIYLYIKNIFINEIKKIFVGYKKIINDIKHVKNMIVVACDDKTVQFWDLKKAKLLHIYRTPKIVNKIAFSVKRKYLFLALRGGEILTLELESLKQIKKIITHKGHIDDLLIDDKDKYLIICSNDIQIRDINTGKLIKILKKQKKGINDAAVSQTSGLLATAANDKTICVWNTEKLSLLQTLEGHNDEVLNVVFSNDDKYIVSSEHQTLRVWDIVSLDDSKFIQQQIKRLEKALHVRLEGTQLIPLNT